LAEASGRLFEAAGAVVRPLVGRVEPTLEGVTVEVISDGRPFTRISPAEDGTFQVDLPPGRFDLVALTPAGQRGPATAAAPDRKGDHVVRLPRTGTLTYRVLDEDGSLLAARLVLLGPKGIRRTIYAATGEGQTPVALGPWRILAVRGFEHDIAERGVDIVTTSSPVSVKLVLRKVVETTGWVSADMHLHAEGSGDSEARFADRVRSLVAEGIEVAVATDHNHVSDYGPAVRALGLQDRLHVISGSEVSTTGAQRWGHFNAFPLEHTPAYHEATPGALFAAIREGDARVIQVNHPRMPPNIGYFDLAGLDPETGEASATQWSDRFDTIEVFNGIWLNDPDRVRRNLKDWYGLLNRGVRAAPAGNSDSHKLVLQEVGWPRTYIRTAQDDPAQLSDGVVVDALRAGRTQVSTGPFIRMTVDGVSPGDTVYPRGRSTLPLEVWVHAPPWVPVNSASVIVDGAQVWNVPIRPASGALRFHGRFDVNVDGAGWIVVLVEGGPHTSPVAPVQDAWSVAFTSAVFVDHAESSPLHSPTDSHAQFDP
jgi:hypothetical protein